MNAVAFDTPLSQAYVVRSVPVPESVTDVPAQTTWSIPALTVGKEFTVIVIGEHVAGEPVWHKLFAVITTVIALPFTKPELV